MTDNPDPTSQDLYQAKRALQKGDRKEARRWAQKAAEHNPEGEEAWLILAALASLK